MPGRSERNCKKEATIVRIMLLCVARTRAHASKHARASERESAREREGERERESASERERARERLTSPRMWRTQDKRGRR